MCHQVLTDENTTKYFLFTSKWIVEKYFNFFINWLSKIIIEIPL